MIKLQKTSSSSSLVRKQTLNESKEGRGTKVLYVGDISVALQKKVCSTKNGVWLGKKED